MNRSATLTAAFLLLVAVSTACSSSDSDAPAQGTAGSGTAGSATAGSGTAGTGTAGSGTAGSGTAGSGTAGSGTAGSGTAGSGTAGKAGSSAMCDVTPEAAPLPTIAMTFAFEDKAMGISVPTTTGGALAGTWIFNKATLFPPAAAKAVLDQKKSKGSGTAWLIADATSYRLHFKLDMTLDLGPLGAMQIPIDSANKGTYTLMVDKIVGVPDAACDDGMAQPEIRFTRDGNKGTVVVHIKSTQGDSDLVLEGDVQ